MAKISIIIPVYNAENYISTCIQSIKEQTFKNIEIILIDDGSTDNSLKICNELQQEDERINVYHQSNGGVSKARNYGIGVATGQYIMFIDIDDEIEPNMVEKMYNCFKLMDVDVVRCNYKAVKNGIIVEKGKLYNLENCLLRGEQITQNIFHFITNTENIPSYCWLLMIKKDKVVSFNTDLYFMEDTQFFINLLLNIDSIYFLNDILYIYNYNTKSSTKSIENISTNINGICKANMSIKDTLKYNNILDDNLEKKMNTTMLYLIIAKLKLLKSVSVFKTNKVISKTFNNELIKSKIQNLETKDLAIKGKIFYILIRLKAYFVLSLILKI